MNMHGGKLPWGKGRNLKKMLPHFSFKNTKLFEGGLRGSDLLSSFSTKIFICFVFFFGKMNLINLSVKIKFPKKILKISGWDGPLFRAEFPENRWTLDRRFLSSGFCLRPVSLEKG